MNFIAKRINLIGILLLLGFTAIAAGMYFDVPARVQKPLTTAKVAENYVCPMHHEVVSAKPGDCPKCGMALVVASKVSSTPSGCGGEMESGCCNKPATDELALPPGHRPVPGFKTQSGCDHGSSTVTNLSK
jgi:hypothetical protein